jgi:hypothetical protein
LTLPSSSSSSSFFFFKGNNNTYLILLLPVLFYSLSHMAGLGGWIDTTEMSKTKGPAFM